MVTLGVPMFFCKHIEKLKSHYKREKLEKNFDFITYDSAREVDADSWNDVLSGKNMYLDLNYLNLLENTPSKNFVSRYVILFHNNKPSGIAYFQVIDFKASVFGNILDSKVSQIKSHRAKLFEHYIDKSGDDVVMRLLTCGNNIVSGEHAFFFKEKLPISHQFKMVEELIERIGKREKLRGKISAILVKDFYAPVKGTPKCFFNTDKYVEFSVEPNMVVDFPKGVNSLESYIALFSKKYRNRAKAILKSGEVLTVKQLTAEEIQAQHDNIYKLYEQVYNHAKFKLVKLPENYFHECKRIFGDKFIFTAFYFNGVPVAFSSGINLNEGCLEAHYIGFDYNLNKEHELYQNILYNFLKQAIELNKQRLNLGRTAAEIKSTIGAKAQDLICYVRPQNTVSKVILKPFISFLQPGEWIPRNPFKEEASLSF